MPAGCPPEQGLLTAAPSPNSHCTPPLSLTLPSPCPTEQALAKPDLYFVTYDMLRQWMEAPVPASQMRSWLKCNTVDFAAEGAGWQGGGGLAVGGGGERAEHTQRSSTEHASHSAGRAPCTSYTVKAGDSLWWVQRRHGGVCRRGWLHLLCAAAPLHSATSHSLPLCHPSLPAGPSRRQRCGTVHALALLAAAQLGGRLHCCALAAQQGSRAHGSLCSPQEVEPADLLALNPALNSSNGAIYMGQRLRLPPWTETCPDSLAGQEPCRNHTVAVRAAEAAVGKGAQALGTSRRQPAALCHMHHTAHVLRLPPLPPQAGEGLYSIAQSYTLTVEDLLSVNSGLTTTSTLRIGQVGAGMGGMGKSMQGSARLPSGALGGGTVLRAQARSICPLPFRRCCASRRGRWSSAGAERNGAPWRVREGVERLWLDLPA